MSYFDDIMDNMDVKVKDLSTVPINYIAFVMDHSGSMCDIADISKNNFNEQLQQIKADSKDHKNYVTIIEFGDTIREVCVNKDIDEVKEMQAYMTNGSTPLYDSIMLAISKIEGFISEDDKSAALVTIITDGYENSSMEHSGQKGRLRVKARIEELQKTGKWTFVFMGADQDILETAVDGLGIYAGNTMSFTSTIDGCRESNVRYMSSYTNWSNNRSGGSTSTVNFFENEVKTDDKSEG